MSDITVYTTLDEPLADMAVDLLAAEGIPARKAAFLKGTLPFTAGGLGAIYITVNAENADRATEILATRFSPADDEAGQDAE